MAEYIFKQSQEIALPRDRVFEFFSNAENLQRITPPELDFHIVTPTPITIEKGTIIDYRLKMHGIPMKWRSEITLWDPPNGRFIGRADTLFSKLIPRVYLI